MTADVPADLIKLRRQFLAAEAEHTRLCRETTSDAEQDPEHHAAVRDAFTTMSGLAVTISSHGWWATVGNRVDAEKALRAAASNGA